MIDQLAEHGYADLRYAASGLHPVALGATLLGAVLIWFLPRRHVAAVFLVVGILIPFEQQIMISRLHFPMIRLLIAVGVLRILARGELADLCLNAFDKVFLWFVASICVVFVLQWRDFDAVVNRCGFAYNALGLYWISRALIRDLDDIKQVFRGLRAIVLVVAACMLVEWKTGRNLFAVFGGVPEITEVREGRLRCQAAFAHPILAGSFGATSLPLLLSFWLWDDVRKRWLVVLSAMAAITIVLTCSSSGPLMAMLAGVFGVVMWRRREHLGRLRWAIVWMLLILHFFIMKASVWALIWRVSAFAGSTGFHRYALVDNFITHLEEWWLLGLRSTEHWGGDAQMWDVANQFVATGINGGIWAFALLVAALVLAFKAVGSAVREKSVASGDRFLCWCLGASLFAHCVGLIGIVYFDQMQIIWYWLLSAFGSLYGMLITNQAGERAPQSYWLKPAIYAIIVLLVARLTAHETRLFF